MQPEWVDFKAIKAHVSIEMALARYGIKLRRVNQEYLRGACPLPTHTSKDGQSCGVHTGKNAWACQSGSCVKANGGKRGGNVLDFVAAMERCSIRDAAAKLQDWFRVTPKFDAEASREGDTGQLVSKREERSDEGNEPLEFTLKGIDYDHPYLATRGITPEIARTFGAGFFPGKGSMASRVVIPIHNRSGQLVAYAGRSIDGTEPKYKLPAGFRKSYELYNLHRAHAVGTDSVIIVEGFFDCIKVHASGYPAVALMGSTLATHQEHAIREFSKVLLMLDGDEAGREAQRTIAAKLMEHTFVKVINLSDGTQPDQLSPDEITALIGQL
jgi:DNA primase